jgi:DNA-binding winged helix-turn-helix (wHTH) protein
MDAESRLEGLEVYAFDEFRLDVEERTLVGSRRRIHLPPKTYALLLALVRRANRLVTKRELLGEVWPNVFVEQGILTVHVAQLRKTLGDDRRSRRYIETVSGAGYRFVATVRRVTGDEKAGGRRAPPREEFAAHV